MLPNPQETADLVTFTEEILNGKLHFLCSVVSVNRRRKDIKVTFVSFGVHAGRFTAECTEYENTLLTNKQDFDILIYVSSNFTLDLRITEHLQCHLLY